jgi:hypothetical protein
MILRRLLSGLVLFAMGFAAMAVRATDDDRPRHPYQSGSNVFKDPDSFITLRAPGGRTFCFSSLDDLPSFGFAGPGHIMGGFFVPLVPARCEDFLYGRAPARVQITFDHGFGLEKDAWVSFREDCARGDKNDPNDQFIDDIKFTELGRAVSGLPARRCTTLYRANEHNPKPYYMHDVIVRRGPVSGLRTEYYQFTARGDAENRGKLDAFMAQVLKTVRITPYRPSSRDD